MNRLGITLKILREEKGFNMEELALKAGISRGIIGEIERGKTNSTVKTLEKISSALGLSKEEKDKLDSAFLGRAVASEVKNLKKELPPKEELLSQAKQVFADENIPKLDKERLLSALNRAFYEAIKD